MVLQPDNERPAGTGNPDEPTGVSPCDSGSTSLGREADVLHHGAGLVLGDHSPTGEPIMIAGESAT